ncbi:hypothetical protein [Rhizobium leguminosarum]|uniref:hypothetical protein n=1 Tax=Rhizobium leguminosarum TaxID=384 RepID=UPI001C9862EB|nr:hypothetical protein [Rhizobium leguminosarum]
MKLATLGWQSQHQLQQSAMGGISGSVHGEQAILFEQEACEERGYASAILASVDRKKRDCYSYNLISPRPGTALLL